MHCRFKAVTPWQDLKRCMGKLTGNRQRIVFCCIGARYNTIYLYNNIIFPGSVGRNWRNWVYQLWRSLAILPSVAALISPAHKRCKWIETEEQRDRSSTEKSTAWEISKLLEETIWQEVGIEVHVCHCHWWLQRKGSKSLEAFAMILS